MKCMKCNKNEANVYYSENINGKRSETYLCSDCAEKVGLKMRVPSFSSRFGGFFEDPFFSEKGVFGGMLDMMRDFDKSFFGEDFFKPMLSEKTEEKESKSTEKACKTCEKEPAKTEKQETVSPRNELQSLKRELKKAVSAEEYEKAAVLRDKIRALEKKSA